MPRWSPWHGCHKISPGCLNCYVYRSDLRYDRDSSIVAKTADFDLPVRRGRDGQYKLRADESIFTCGTSDFFLEDADEWRPEAWSFIRARRDLRFLIITKRIHRFYEKLPDDWGEGYENVAIGCTSENQNRADYRLPIFLEAPIKHRFLICEPLLEGVNLNSYLSSGKIELVVAGGESGAEARTCRYDWIVSIRDQCVENNVPFHFKQTGAHFEKGGRTYHIERQVQHSQAAKALLDYSPSGRGDAFR